MLEVVANNPSWNAERIHDHLRECAERMGVSADLLPSERTISRYKRAAREDELIPLRLTRWPETFVSGVLPLEAAPHVRPLLAHALREGWRPEVRLARWYWIASITAPDLGHERHLQMAGSLVAADAGAVKAVDELRRSVELAVLGLPQPASTAVIEGDDLLSMMLLTGGFGGRYRRTAEGWERVTGNGSPNHG